MTIQLPPLRDRRSDIPLLVEHFLAESRAANKKPQLGVTDQLAEFLEHYDWPGNVRQLRNVVESMVVLAHGNVLSMHDLPHHLAAVPKGRREEMTPTAFEATPKNLERVTVLRMLERHHGNRRRAAEGLGVSIRTLQRRLKAWRVAAGCVGHDPK